MAYIPEETTHVDRYSKVPITPTNQLVTEDDTTGIPLGPNSEANIVYNATENSIDFIIN